MFYFQKWSKNTFEELYLKEIENKIKIKPNLNIYIGFDYGFFLGSNIYYCNEKGYELAKNIYNKFIMNKQCVRLFTNIDVDSNYDLIIFLGYSNLKKEKIRLKKNKKQILKVFSQH